MNNLPGMQKIMRFGIYEGPVFANSRPICGHVSPDQAFGFNVIGNISANTGLGVHARHLVTLILDKGFPGKALRHGPQR